MRHYLRLASNKMRHQIILALILLLMNNSFVRSIPTNSEVEQKVKEITSEKKCDEPVDPGTCKNTIRKWHFDVTTKECKEFVWTGCEGNQNRFENEEECIYHCLTGESQVTSTTTTQPTTTKKTTSTTKRRKTLGDDGTTVMPVPEEERGSELTFNETGYEKTFMFAKNNTFIQMDGQYIQTFQLRLCREISFQFRTRLPHGLLVYHNVKTPDGIELEPYALYVIVEKGQLKVVHVFGKHATSVTVGEGLNRDDWHSVMVRIDVHGARLIARVDENQEEVYLKGLKHDTNYGVAKNLPSVVLVGGLSSEEKLHGVKYIIESFVGCIRNVVLSSGKAASDLLPITPLIATKHENVVEGCFNRCHTRHNLCFVSSKCINHYHETSCDCFGTEYEGELCDLYTATTLTLRGSSHVSYRIYDWKDRVHSSATRISLIFKTRFDDSVLFYASGESIKHQYIAASIKNKTVYVEMDLGDGVMQKKLERIVTNNIWHNLTIIHNTKNVTIFLDYKRFHLEVPGSMKKILFDPEIYFGGGPYLSKKKGLASTNKFVGSLKYVFYNDVSILYELKKGNPKVHYIGVLQEEYNETDVDVVPITFPFATSHVWWPIVSTKNFNFKFDFRSSRITAVLAYCDLTTLDSMGYWELRLQDDKISFDLIPDSSKNFTDSTSIRMSPTFEWHTVSINYMNGELRMSVDHLALETKYFDVAFNVSNRLIIGSSLRAATSGLVGCMKNLRVNNTNIDPRNLMETEQVVGEVALDNCNYIDPCKRPNTCEHGGQCFVQDDRITCDCTGTGYVGKNCHFTQYRKTCEELALLGYVKSKVYLIDIDGNGVFPPAHVKCQFQTLNDETITVVEHNLPSQIDVRSRKEIDFSFNIKYREFSPEMLQELVSHSLYCKQYIRYDCYKAPLELYSSTWFTSSANNFTVDYLGNAKRGSCECSMNKTCENPTQACNCDNNENKWLSDDGEFKDSRSLGITGMYFLQQRDLDEEAQGRITLGPLECVETNTQRYVVTFTTSQSYIEVPGWRKGDIAFSFRTTGEQAILLFQPPIRPNYPSFMVALTGENQLTFNFTLNTGTTRELVINSTRKLNAGEWHKIWIDYNEYHVRFMINTDSQMVDLLQKEEFGPFEGSMFIGGATADLSKKLAVKQGLIGCFRGLVVNGEILDIYSYMSVHLSEIIKDCKPSCVPYPCRNGAQCKELWSTFQCVCNNPWAHIGEFCETNINDNAVTFVNRSSYFIRNYVGNNSNYEEKEKIKNILTQNILINLRTYDTHSLVFYANDHFNNFVSLYITDSKEIVFLFNNDNEIVNLTIAYDEFTTNVNANASIQIAIIRTEASTSMHVNEKNVTIDKGFVLIEEYSNKPWINPELEILSPHRPIAPPTDYFQLVIGGYDVRHLLKTNPDAEDLQGYIGCVRGFKIGNNIIEIENMLKLNEAYVKDGVLPDCKMSCDSTPCKNGGICTENFEKKESTCNCDQTSFIGEFCHEEKGGDFNGDSIIQRKFILKDKVDTIKLTLVFSSGDLRRTNRIMLLIQTENNRNYYILVAITPEGYLQFEEDREQKEKYVATIKKNFLNNARHSVYYYRDGDNATLIVDRQPPEILKHEPRSNTPQSSDSGTNEVQIGGINTTDSRFSTYKSYSGCLSNIFIRVNNYTMKPLEEYMLFTKTGAENVTVINAQGVRSAQCHAYFEIANNSTPELPLNLSLGTDKAWVEEPPKREPYKSIYINSFKKEEKTQVVFITLATLFVVIIICCIIEVYRTHVAYKKRIERETDEGIILAKEQATKLHESPGVTGKPFNYKPVPLNDPNKVNEPNKLATNLVGILKNGNTTPIPNNIQTTVNDELTTPVPNKVEAPVEKDKDTIKDSLTDSQLLDQELESIDETEELLNDEEDEQNNYNENINDNEEKPEQLKVENKTINHLNSPHIIRPRQRQVSWGPPPIAPLNSTQLPFKIEESPTDNPTSHNL